MAQYNGEQQPMMASAQYNNDYGQYNDYQKQDNMYDYNDQALNGVKLEYAEKEDRQNFIRRVCWVVFVELVMLTILSALGLDYMCKGTDGFGAGLKRFAHGDANGVLFAPSNKGRIIWVGGLHSFASIVFLCMVCCCRPMIRSPPGNYIACGLCVCMYSALVSMSCVILLLKCDEMAGPVLLLAAASTAILVIALVTYATCTNDDFTGIGPYLFMAVMCIFVATVGMGLLTLFGVIDNAAAGMFYLVVDFIMILIFSMYLIYDVQMIIGGKGHSYGVDDHVWAGTMVFVDIIVLFLRILSILMEIFGKR